MKFMGHQVLNSVNCLTLILQLVGGNIPSPPGQAAPLPPFGSNGFQPGPPGGAAGYQPNPPPGGAAGYPPTGGAAGFHQQPPNNFNNVAAPPPAFNYNIPPRNGNLLVIK